MGTERLWSRGKKSSLMLGGWVAWSVGCVQGQLPYLNPHFALIVGSWHSCVLSWIYDYQHISDIRPPTEQ